MNIELKERNRDDLLEIISAKDMKITMQKIEIEEIRNELINNDEYIGKLQKEYDKEIERLHSIIKEVREYIINNSYESGDTSSMYLIDVDKLLDILDKENI